MYFVIFKTNLVCIMSRFAIILYAAVIVRSFKVFFPYISNFIEIVANFCFELDLCVFLLRE